MQKLVASVAALAAPGSRLRFDFLHQAALDGPKEAALPRPTPAYPGFDACAEVCQLKGEPFLSGFEPVPEAMGSYLQPLGWLLHGLWSPREMVAAQLPHLAWSDALPPILSFYSYAEARKPGAGLVLIRMMLNGAGGGLVGSAAGRRWWAGAVDSL